MDKNYDHKKYESEIYKQWEQSGAFAPKGDGKPFSIIMPPPNANDPLHVGHAMFVSIEDILTRYHRMLGESTLWLPGTDHAGIETQFVFEKKLAKQDKSRFDYDHDTLYKMIWDYVQENSGTAVDQMKKLGASADWNRYKFTLDPDIVASVNETFIRLHKDGLIYRGEKLVNYCTKCGTGYSELEIEHEERIDNLYYVNYQKVDGSGFITVATTRPEPIWADTHLAVNPKNRKTKDLIGQRVVNPITGSEMEIIGDEFVDPEFGTGIVKLTPAHDPNDFAAAQKHHLPIVHAISTQGKMLGGPFAGKKVAEARKLTVELLQSKGAITKIDDKYSHSIAVCYRCHSIIEPLPLLQFFIKVAPLVEKAVASLDSGETIILGAGRDKILRHWLTNLRDWNISRQIVWGIRMPIWYNKNQDYVVSLTSPGEGYTQETDTFDTWFSSGQWPVLTLKSNPGDFDKFYPTSVMETGYDILPFWVMRMMLLGIYLTGKSPFSKVYLHGLVRDEKGQKMSKSKGNVINPLDMVEKYGADAIRMALVIGSTPGQDKSVGEPTIRGMRNFSNKIWNAARFVEGFTTETTDNTELSEQILTWSQETAKHLDNLRPGQAAEWVYNEFWHNYCDKWIEEAKNGKVGKKQMTQALTVLLKNLHPFMPFVTEAVWQELKLGDKMLIESSWPSA